MTADRRLRALSIAVLLVLSGGILASWYTDRLFPWLHVGVSAAVVLVLLSNPFDTDRSQFQWTVGLLCTAGVTYRALLVLFPDTLPGHDSEKYALFARLTIATGDYTMASLPFYGTAGGFHTYVAETAILTGLPPEQAIGVAALLMGVFVPTAAASFSLLFFDTSVDGYAGGTIAAAVGTVLALSVRISMIPFAQTFGTLLFVAFLFLVLKELYTGHELFRWASYAVGMVTLLTAMALTHKIPLLLATGCATIAWIVTGFAARGILWPFGRSRRALPFSVVVITVLITVAQQRLVSSYTTRGLERARNVVTSAGQVPTRTGLSPEVATVPDTGWLAVFESHSHAPALFVVAGTTWLIVVGFIVASEERPRAAIVAFLSIVGVVTGLVFVSLAGATLPEAVHPFRIQAFQEVLLAALCGSGIAVYRNRISDTVSALSQSQGNGLLLSVIVVVILLHSFSSIATPAFPGQQRAYLTDSEMAGKQFAVDHTNGTVDTDDLLARRTPYPDRVTAKSNQWAQLGSVFGVRFTENNGQLLNGTAAESDAPTMIYRPDADIYAAPEQFRNFRYRLQWDVESSADRANSRVYDSGGAVVYRNSTYAPT